MEEHNKYVEKDLYDNTEDLYGIYQLKDSEDIHRKYMFRGMDELEAAGLTVDKSNYELVYVGKLEQGMKLDDIYMKLNINHPEDYKGHSLSVSDVVLIHKNGENKGYFVDDIGYRQVPEFEKLIEDKEPEITLIVSECSEFHSMGELHEGVKSVDQAIELFNGIPPQRMNGIRGIGINIHTPGTETYMDTQIDILNEGFMDLEVLEYVPVVANNEKAISMIKELMDKTSILKNVDKVEIRGSLDKWVKEEKTKTAIESKEKEEEKADKQKASKGAKKENGKVTAFDKVMDSRKELVDKIVEQMQSGKIIWRAGWNNTLLFPHNPVSSAVYKGGNCMKLMVEGIVHNYNDPRWCTYKQAEEKGWNIKKGEKGVLLEKWIFTQEMNVEKEIDGEIVEVKETVRLEKPKVNYFYVFNATQIEGIEPFEPGKLIETDKDLLKLKDDIIESSECPIREKMQGEAFYSPAKDEIILPPMESFHSLQDYIATMLHEMSHSTGHESRLNREIKNQFGTPEYAKEELRAELGSVFTQSQIGMKISESALKNHSGYLQSWIKACKDDYNEFYRACNDAQKICDRLIENYEKVRDKELTIDQTLKEFKGKSASDKEKVSNKKVHHKNTQNKSTQKAAAR